MAASAQWNRQFHIPCKNNAPLAKLARNGGRSTQAYGGGSHHVNTDICFLNVTELAPLVRARKISPVEIVQALLSRIDALNDDLLAYLHVSAEQAMAAAQAAEIEIGSGGYRGPLHGIPVAYKDIYDVQGLPTTAGSKIMAGYVAPADSTVAARLRHAGAICLGKLNTIEFASGSMEVFGISAQPVEHGHVSGRFQLGLRHSPGRAHGTARHRQ